MLDIRVQTFLTVCDTMNYTRAAERLHMTQPAVTKQIQALEEHYQVTLFQYHNRTLTLTRDGELLRHVLTSMSQDLRQLHNELHRKGERTRIRIGATLSIGNYSLVKILPEMLRTFPDVDISLTIADTKILLEGLDNNHLDFIFCEGNFNKSLYDHRIIHEVPLAVFCGADYDIGEIPPLTNLLDHTLLLREKGSGTREITETFLNSHGYSIRDFRNYHEFNHSGVILQLLTENAGISILYENVGEEKVAQGLLRKIPIGHNLLVHEFNVIWNKSNIPDPFFLPYVDYLYEKLLKVL